MIPVCGDPADPATAPVRARLATALGRTTPGPELRRGGDSGLRRVDVAADPRLDRYDAAGREALGGAG